MNSLPKSVQITIAVMAILLTLLVPSVGYVYGSITDLKITGAVHQEKIETMVKQIDDLWKLFHPGRGGSAKDEQ